MTPRPIRNLALAALIAGILPGPADAGIRVMTYNLLNYSSGRENFFRPILQQIQPDVVVVEEILSQGAVDNFLANVLNNIEPGQWAAGPFVNGSDTDNGFFYRTSAVSFVGHFVIGTALRDIDEYTFRPATHASSAADVRVYVVHLKASQGSTNEAKRLAEVTLMRTRMETFPPNGNYMVAGDFNIYTDTETPYQYMTNPANGANGVVCDPINREGNWHINSAFADIHTQSPRTTSFGGGSTGGMDDRFDMILTGPATKDGEGFDVDPSSYTSFGQDGMHFDTFLDQPPYTVVDSATAHALHDGSDHLPVFTDFQSFAQLVTDASVDFGSVIIGGTAATDLSVQNGAPAADDDLDYSLSAPTGFTAPAGSFSLAGGVSALQSLGMDSGSVGAKAGNLTVTSDDPDNPSASVPLTGAVLAHAQPSVDAGTLITSLALDLGTVAPGDTASAPADAHNFAYGSLQALLDVHSFTLTGDPRFFLTGFTPAQVGATPASFPVGFDAAGAAVGNYLGTLTLHTRDQQDLSGASSLSDLVFDLSADVSGGAVDVAADPGAPDRSGFVSVRPNPFRPLTELHFALRSTARVELRIYDVRGTLVRQLSDGRMGPGFHQREWNGRDDNDRSVAPGIYFARLVTDGVVETRKLVKVR